MTDWLGMYNYWIAIALMMIGFYCVITSSNFAKKLIGLMIFQTSVLLLYVAMGKIIGSSAPILQKDAEGEIITAVNDLGVVYANPLPHVLMLTAIVVGVALTAVGLSIVVRIKEAYGTIEEDDILEIENKEKS
ncbi:MAG: cation:proton antiporter subunit C [Rickettsiales bacterium]|nr:cation:proton antiporter subunit C [Rickettsiales bacterium]